MHNIPDDKSGNSLAAQSDARGPQDVYEISLDSCRHLISWRDHMRGHTIWFFDGMVNSIKPMWALLFGRYNDYILGFVWVTKTSLSQVTSQDVIGVRCEVWPAQSILRSMELEQQDLTKYSRNLLGTTTLSFYEIQNEGSTATFKYSF